ncbi:2Fe-2S iron-sulfur cluster-binding protein [Flavivirga spongiicola]|uniref:2Fe-2S iron-sulfur cluster-binding protein n=1 Tax=Flavivirga spongiicola TaxID=421621 RepID=A0ABU7XZ63_9FLAO|nr:2Fe-2S iron-sulfur cluster-binding protein [Flavivirga sp. MEBiC05379]MDO5981083.1 2Fe-2S iron-sulfur cluster-binding protein [Flavivirga sp. MEBiC05379]
MNQINIIDSYNEIYKIPYRQFEYPNLMELIIDNLYDDIGGCLGRGLCGTCHVELVSGSMNVPIHPSEKETLSKINSSNKNSRLACQIILDEKINNMTFKIKTEDNINL